MGFNPQASHYCHLGVCLYFSQRCPSRCCCFLLRPPLPAVAGVDMIRGSSRSLGWLRWWDRGLPPDCHHASPSRSAVGAREAWAGCSPLMEGAASLPDPPPPRSPLAQPPVPVVIHFLVSLWRTCEWVCEALNMDNAPRWPAQEEWQPGSATISSQWRPLREDGSWGPGSPRPWRFYCFCLWWCLWWSLWLVAK